MAITEITINGTRFEVRAIPDTPEQTTKEGLWNDLDLLSVIQTAWLMGTWKQSLAPSKILSELKASKQSQSNTPKEESFKFSQELPKDVKVDWVDTVAKEEQPSKDWEIVGYYCKHENSKKIYKDDNTIDPLFSLNFQNPSFWESKGNQIHSVRRLSDNEVFSVEDEITFNDEAHKMKITCFNYLNGCILVGFGNDSTVTPVFLDNTKKLPSTKPSEQPKERTYTQSELDKAIEETWKAARKLDEWDYHHTPYQYRTLADYLSSIKKQ